jgi:flagellar basal body-associated protein FliL
MSNLTDLVKDVTYFYIKYFYEQELEKTKQKKLLENELQNLINNLYIEKSLDLKKYIRDTLKENLKEQYSSFSVENILLEMFADPELSKHRVFLEIINYQNSL